MWENYLLKIKLVEFPELICMFYSKCMRIPHIQCIPDNLTFKGPEYSCGINRKLNYDSIKILGSHLKLFQQVLQNVQCIK